MKADTTLDVQQAERDPTSVFSTPRDVLLNESLSRDEKLRILRRWKLDALDMDVAAEENMPGGEQSLLADVIEALAALGDDGDSPRTGATKHGF